MVFCMTGYGISDDKLPLLQLKTANRCSSARFILPTERDRDRERQRQTETERDRDRERAFIQAVLCCNSYSVIITRKHRR